MADMRKILTRLLEEVDKEDRETILEELKGKKLTGKELLEAIKELDKDSRAEVRKLLADVEEEIEEEEDDDDSKKKTTKVKNEDEDDDDGKKKTPKVRTRPGRKSGRAYGWWIDDDGEVVRLDIARVYSGPDEPDEVDLLPKKNEDEDEDEDEDVA